MTTRISLRSIPSADASWPCSPCGICVDAQNVSRPSSSTSAAAAVGLHRHHGDALVHVAPAHDVVGAGEAVDRRIDVDQGLRWSRATSKITGAPSSNAASASITAGSGSMSAHTVAAASSPCSERLGEHDGDRLADEAHPAVGERRPDEVGMHRDEPVVGGHAERVGGEDGDDAGHPDRIVDVDRAEHAVGHVGADEHGVQPVRRAAGRPGTAATR